jgi:hypothetical protein
MANTGLQRLIRGQLKLLDGSPVPGIEEHLAMDGHAMLALGCDAAGAQETEGRA